MYKLCWPNGTVFNTYETRIDAEIDQSMMPPFEETIIVYEEPSQILIHAVRYLHY